MDKDEYTFIEEQVNERKHRKVILYAGKIGVTALLAALFGAIAAVAFNFVHGMFPDAGNGAPAPTYVISETQAPEAGSETAKPSGGSGAKSSKDRFAGYVKKEENIAEFCKEQEDMVVMVSEVEADVDYFDSPVENVISYAGLVVGKDKDMMYVLTRQGSVNEAVNYAITLNDGTRLDAVYQASDTATGLMVIRADISDMEQSVRKDIKVAGFGESSGVGTGSMVFAIGAPMGDMHSVSYGYVCSDSIKKYLSDRSVSLFKTNMRFSKNGSGYVINSNRQVIGIISDIFFDGDDNAGTFLGITPLKGLINQLISGEDRASAGIILQDIGDDYLTAHTLENGVYIQNMNSDAPALQAGLSIGDVIISVNGKSVSSVEEYTGILEKCGAGEEIPIEIYRAHISGSNRKIITVKLGKI